MKKTISDAGVFAFDLTARHMYEGDIIVRIEFAADDYATRDVSRSWGFAFG